MEENNASIAVSQDCVVYDKLFKKRSILKVNHCSHNRNNINNNNNMNINENQQHFLCSFCNLPFQKLNHLRKHISKCHGDDRRKSFSTQFQCCECMRMFPTFLKLIEHDLTMHKEDGDLMFCAICNSWVQATADILMSHYIRDHVKEVELIEKFRKYIIWKNVPKNLFQCTLCFDECPTFSEFLTHLGTMHEIEANLQAASGTVIVCEYCGRVFPEADDVVKHIIRSHWTDAKSVCVKCGKDFGSVCAAKKHFRSYRCSVLRQEFNDLGIEIRKDMYKEPSKSVQCHKCDTTCKNAGALKIHMRKHTGEKPFQCNQCQLAFTQIGNLNKHKESFHGDGKKSAPRECRYPCRECGRKFITMADVRAHERIHTGEKPFSCPHCKRGFTQRGNLNIHLKRWHFGIKQIPLGGTPSFKVNKTNIGSNENGAEFKFFYFTIPVSKKKIRESNTNCSRNANINSNNKIDSNANIPNNSSNLNYKSNNNNIIGSSKNSDTSCITRNDNSKSCIREDANTGGVFSKFKTEKPKKRLDDNIDFVFPEVLSAQSAKDDDNVETINKEYTSNPDRIMYLPFNIDILGSDYCVSPVDDGSSYCGTPTVPHVINQTVITSLTDHLSRDDDTCSNPSNQCLPMYTEVIDHVGSDSYSTHKCNSQHHNALRSSDNVHRNSDVVTMPALDNEVFTITDHSNKDSLSTMNVEELFRTSLDSPTSSLENEEDADDAMKFLNFSTKGGTSLHQHTIDCTTISNDMHTLNWLHNHSPPLGGHFSTTTNQHNLITPIPTVLKNVSGGEIRDLDTLDLSYPRHF